MAENDVQDRLTVAEEQLRRMREDYAACHDNAEKIARDLDRRLSQIEGVWKFVLALFPIIIVQAISLAMKG